MKSKVNFFKALIPLFLITYVCSDSFDNNFYNNHGSVGLINIPTARFFDEEVHGITVYDGTPDQKITLTSNPYDWFEASFFYTNIPKIELCRGYFGKTYCQGYKDKGFNLKVRLKQEGQLPAIAIGLNDFAG
ncbi:MAG: YjbH domain-containing protein, partial [Proteobacteria bacterium]|nr:YjbH domain-containing protein [Pseudomonadota bacterium]